MISALARKGRQVLEDPVLRRWLLRRAIGLERGPTPYVPGRPPYLADADLAPKGTPVWAGAERRETPPPSSPIVIELAGETMELAPDDPGHLFNHRYEDLETMLSAHRFAWLPLPGGNPLSGWVDVLWESWRKKHGEEEEGWPWHPYTAAERAINIIDFARIHGLPGNADATVQLLAKHARLIAASLEYFGDHYTSNHLSNNGRGLLKIGCALNLREFAALGARIMAAEADRLFGGSGLLREGSAHYHLLLTRNYIDGWQEAARFDLPETTVLKSTAQRALTAAHVLSLPGGVPLIGDISPDSPPDFLESLSGRDVPGWLETLDAARRAPIDELMALDPDSSCAQAAGDGWHRFGNAPWSALAFVPIDGWAPMPGHGHRDAGGFELHWQTTPVLTDPGRGSYRDTAEDNFYVSAAAHNTLLIDGEGQSPANRPYYGDRFRTAVAGARPEMSATRSGKRLVLPGYSRLKGIEEVSREWRFDDTSVEIVDRIEGRGSRRIRRQFCTPLEAAPSGTGAVRLSGDASFEINCGGAVKVKDIVRWHAYGRGQPGNQIISDRRVELPAELTTTLRRI